MKTQLIFFMFVLIVSNTYAQVGIGTVSPNSTLDVRGSFAVAFRSFISGTSASATDHTLVFTGTAASAVTLPDASACTGRIYFIKNGSTTLPVPVLTINTTSSQTIDGISTLLLNQTYSSVIVVSNGTNWNVSAQTASPGSGTAWTLGGNTTSALQNIGTVSNYDLPFITNNIEGMRLSAAGNFGIGTSTFNATNPEKLIVNSGTTTSVNAIVGKGSINNYLQLNIQNSNAGTNASSDVVATADNGTETTNYVDLGINSSVNTSGTMGNANDAYLYNMSQNFLIGTGVASKALIFMTGGTTQSANERMRIDGSGNVGIGTNSPSAKLHIIATTGNNPLLLQGLPAGSPSDNLLTINTSTGIVNSLPYSSLANSWSLYGNTGTNSAADFIGTLDNRSLSLGTNNTQRMYMDSSSGNVGVGTNTPGSNFTVFQKPGSGSSQGFRFTGNSIGGTGSGSGFLMSLGYNVPGNKQLWLGDADYAGNAAGTFVRFTSFAGTVSVNAIAGDNSVRRPIAFGEGGDPLSAIIFGTDDNETAPGSYVWDNGNMAVGNGYRANIAPANGLIVQGNVGIGTASPSTALHVVGTNPLTLTGVQTGTSTDSILTITNGLVRKLSPSALAVSSNAWALAGNSVPSVQNIGTTTNYDLPFITNNTERMRISNSGNAGIGASAFNATNPEKLLVQAGTTTSFNLMQGHGKINNYLQLNVQNDSAGNASSSDLVATADNGNESVNYVDMGINSSANTQNVMGSANDAYLYSTGNNFLIGNGTTSKSLIFMTGGTAQSSNERMRIDGSGNLGVGTATPNSTIQVNGSVAYSIISYTAGGTFTLGATNYTVIITAAAGAITLNLPAASTCTGRIYVLVNKSGNTQNTGSYLDLAGNSTTSLLSHTSYTLQSNGASWDRVQ
jgi:hypothetical protein